MNEVYKEHWEQGRYHCAKCGHPLFDSSAKFRSGTAWPSFRKAEADAVATQPDNSFGMERTELLCKACGLHLGHVFDDGRYCGDTHPEAGERYCILSEALDFRPPTEPA
jgi:peptide-methionine (R)-S-oxide reductase